MTKRAVRSAIGTVALVMVFMTPADAFTSGNGQSAAVPWYRNTFVKLRAAGTHPVELRAPVPPPEVQVPGIVQNLRRADGR